MYVYGTFTRASTNNLDSTHDEQHINRSKTDFDVTERVMFLLVLFKNMYVNILLILAAADKCTSICMVQVHTPCGSKAGLPLLSPPCQDRT